MANRAVLISLLRQAMVTKTTAEWIAALEAETCALRPINDIGQVSANPQVQARGMKIEMPHAVRGIVPLVATPIHLSATPVQYRIAPPTLGEHAAAVLADWLR